MAIDTARILYLVLLMVAVGGFLIVEFRRDAGATARGALAWGLIIVGLIAGFGLWQDIRGQLAPRQQVLDGGARIEVPIGPDGHYHLTATVNGAPVRFVVDTGASTLALAPDDARRAGIDPDRLAYAGQARTAGGMVATAAVRLGSLRIGDVEDRAVAAMVIDADPGVSLMGMDYLSRFARVRIEGGTLVLER